MEGVETVASIIARYALFEQFYLDGSSKAKDQLISRLVELYAAVLIYLSKAYHFYNRNTLSQIPHWSMLETCH
jgi:HD superfamily phosphohydrolase